MAHVLHHMPGVAASGVAGGGPGITLGLETRRWRPWIQHRRAWLLLIPSLLLALLLGGCGTPLATVADPSGKPVMLLGYDPVAYFTQGKPQRGKPELRVDLPQRSYYFASAEHKKLFEAAPAKYEPQYGGFCASGAAFAIKLGSDPTSWVMRDGRLFIFGDIVGQVVWELDPAWNIGHADRLWPAIADRGWRAATLSAYFNKVPHYRTGAELKAEWLARNPGKSFTAYNPGGMLDNLFLKPPGWRAAEGAGQPALGYPGQ